MRNEAGEFPCGLSGPCRDRRPTWAGARSSGWRWSGRSTVRRSGGSTSR